MRRSLVEGEGIVSHEICGAGTAKDRLSWICKDAMSWGGLQWEHVQREVQGLKRNRYGHGSTQVTILVIDEYS